MIAARGALKVLAAGGLLLLAGPATARAVAPDAEALRLAVRGILEEARQPSGLWIACEQVHADRALTSFYRNRGYEPVWVADDGPRPTFGAAVSEIRGADRHGLVPEEYHLGCLEAAVDRFERARAVGARPEVRDLAEQEIILSDAFVTFGSHLAAGKVDPERVYPLWLAPRREQDVFSSLSRLASSGDVGRAVRELAPVAAEYWRMVEALDRLRAISDAGGWGALAFARDLQVGMRDPHLSAVRANLAARGDLDAGLPGGDLFDPALERAVRAFQARHGLAVDGVIGPETRRELSVSVAQRRVQLQVNLERSRWLPRQWGSRYLLVDTADFSLAAFQEGTEVLRMRVIVGEAYTKTPVFSRTMEYLEVNPYWNIPDGIATRELLPRIQADPGFLARQRMELLSGWHAAAQVVDPATVAWAQVAADTFPGRLRQLPGPWNALGRVKFMFPNRFHVYLHDTPARHLFEHSDRALSHGCIRVERPLELALFVLQDDPRWTRERLEQLIAAGERQVIPLPKPTIVHLLYRTAWVNEGDKIEFRRDIYGRDEVLWAALRGTPLAEAEVTQRAGGGPVGTDGQGGVGYQ